MWLAVGILIGLVGGGSFALLGRSGAYLAARQLKHGVFSLLGALGLAALATALAGGTVAYVGVLLADDEADPAARARHLAETISELTNCTLPVLLLSLPLAVALTIRTYRRLAAEGAKR
jgi:hypothetical protein